MSPRQLVYPFDSGGSERLDMAPSRSTPRTATWLLFLLAACVAAPASAQDDVIGSVFVRTSLGDFVVDLEEGHPVVQEYAEAFANLVRDRVFFHKSDKQLGCTADDPTCRYCECDTTDPILDCHGEDVGTCPVMIDPDDENPQLIQCRSSGYVRPNQTLRSRVLHAGRFYLDENNALQESGVLVVSDPKRPGVFENEPLTVAFVRNSAGDMTSEWVINLEDNSEFFDGADGTQGADAYMVIGSVNDDTGALSALASLPTFDARCNCDLNPIGATACNNAPGIPNTPDAILKELTQLPVIDPTRPADPDDLDPPDIAEPFLLHQCDLDEPLDRVCRLPLCTELTENGVECQVPLCYAISALDTPEEIEPGVPISTQCDFPITPNIPLIEFAEPTGLRLVNNGLAPPEPANVLDFANNPQLTVDVRDDGCGAVDDPLASCDIAGVTTFFEVASGGSGSLIRISDFSRLRVSDGEIGLGLETYDNARAALEDGLVGPIASFGTSDVALEGSNVSAWTLNGSSTGLLTDAEEVPITLDAADTSFLRIAGSGFKIDNGSELSLPASVSATSGDLDGILASGRALEATFTRASDAGVDAEIHLLDGAELADRQPFIPIGNPGNAPDDTGFGAVANFYVIGQTEVTNAEYAAFLNANARIDDPYDLWDSEMEDDARGGIARTGAVNNHKFEVMSGREQWPVVFVSRFDAVRYTNWLHNGQPIGDDTATEQGAYTFSVDVDDVVTATRSAAARYFVPTRDEWYKAAYYDPASQIYFDYPTSSDTQPGNAVPTRELGNAANTNSALGDNSRPLSDAGAYRFSASPYGTLDQAGNVLEWLEDSNALFGSHWDATPALSAAGSTIDVAGDDTQQDFLGFRVPEPSAGALAAVALATITALRRRRSPR